MMVAMTKVLLASGAASGVMAATWPLDWYGSAARVAQFVFDAYFVAFIDAVNFGTLCF